MVIHKHNNEEYGTDDVINPFASPPPTFPEPLRRAHSLEMELTLTYSNSTESFSDHPLSVPPPTFPPIPVVDVGVKIKSTRKRRVRGSKLSPSLRNECKEIYKDLRSQFPKERYKTLGNMIHDMISIRHPEVTFDQDFATLLYNYHTKWDQESRN